MNHPLPLNTKVQARVPVCACTGANTKVVIGTILKVINNHSGIWYYLDVGTTVKSTTIEKVI